MARLLLLGAAVGGAAMYLLDSERYGLALRPRNAADRALVQRVRANMGRHVAHPGDVEVSARRGCVVLSGWIFAHEHSDFVDAVRNEPGVSHVDDRLAVFEKAEGISELQGNRAQGESHRQNWPTAAARVLAGAGATWLVLMLLGSGPGRLLGAAGALLLLSKAASSPLPWAATDRKDADAVPATTTATHEPASETA